MSRTSCPVCGGRNTGNAVICKRCGWQIEEDPVIGELSDLDRQRYQSRLEAARSEWRRNNPSVAKSRPPLTAPPSGARVPPKDAGNANEKSAGLLHEEIAQSISAGKRTLVRHNAQLAAALSHINAGNVVNAPKCSDEQHIDWLIGKLDTIREHGVILGAGMGGRIADHRVGSIRFSGRVSGSFHYEWAPPRLTYRLNSFMAGAFAENCNGTFSDPAGRLIQYLSAQSGTRLVEQAARRAGVYRPFGVGGESDKSFRDTALDLVSENIWLYVLLATLFLFAGLCVYLFWHSENAQLSETPSTAASAPSAPAPAAPLSPHSTPAAPPVDKDAALLRLAQKDYDMGAYKQSLHVLEDIKFSDARACELTGVFEAKMGRFDDALDDLQSAANMSPSNASYLLNLTALYINMKDYDDAAGTLKTLVRVVKKGGKVDAQDLARSTTDRDSGAKGGSQVMLTLLGNAVCKFFIELY